MSEKTFFHKIVNFDRCIQFKDLHRKMGIIKYPKMPDIKFERVVEKTVKYVEVLPEELEIERELASSAIDLEFDDISVENGFLCYEGRKVAAYIRDQPHHSIVKFGVDPENETSGYKFHLCNCKTLQNMSAEGRERRYFVTKRKDGLFNVNCMLKSDVEPVEVSLQMCNYCKSMLSRMRIPAHQISLGQYFDRYDTYIPKSINRYETFSQVQDYSDDHAAVAERCKKETDYTCQKCCVQCKTNKSLLHLHHRNGVKSDNFPNNLQVLCADCHSKKFMHEHLINTCQSQIRMIYRMRLEQGILDLGKHG